MTLSFDDVVARLLEEGATDAVLTTAKSIAIVRDPRGRVRLALDAPDAKESDRADMETSLKTALGGWYDGPALYVDGTPAEKRIAQEVLKLAKGHWPVSWPSAATSLVGVSKPLDLTRWSAVQRLLSKESWLSDQTIASPWPLREQTPTIVSFYSYKGGVGRSTLVAVIAAILAREGETVAVIDLDLEAPGQQALFDAVPLRGVIDYLMAHLAHGKGELDGLFVDVTTQVKDATGKVLLASAGEVGWPYVEKIARLDFVGHTGDDKSPVQEALTALLKDVRRVHKPTWILLDARTGIHDLGGLAMHALAHIDVLVARDGRQGREGLDLCLRALARRRSSDDILTLMVHALAPAPLSDEAVSKPVQARFRHEIYELFKKTVYSNLSDGELPDEDDAGEAHTPYAVPLDPTLGRLELLRDMADIAGQSHYTHIVSRLRELGAPVEEQES